MKTLLILRHGKAEDYNVDGDKFRNLTDRGRRDAKRMGQLIADRFGDLDHVVSSFAERAAETAALTVAAAGFPGEIECQQAIYGASSRTLQTIVRALPNDAETALLVGHNPGLEELVADLSGEPGSRCQLATCALAQVSLPDPWAAAVPGSGALVGVWTP